MSYHSLISNDRQKHSSVQPQAGFRFPKFFDRVLVSRKHSQPFDELPLVSAANFPRHSAVKDSVRLSVLKVDGSSYNDEATIESQSEYIRLGSNEAGERRTLRDSFNAFFRFLGASGPRQQSNDNDHTPQENSRRLPTGWRLGTWICCIAVVLCVVFEVSFLAWAVRTSNNRRGAGVLLAGNCRKVRELELWLLLPLNIAGTMLIGTSNYVMQVVSAPERTEIDEAHAYGKYIAVAGIRFRDLRVKIISGSRQTIWWTLCLSSVPIHFLLNVAVFSSVQASNTGVLVVQDNFEQDKGWEYCDSLSQNKTIADLTACDLYKKHKMGMTKHNTVLECQRQYSNGFQTNASSVIVVTNGSSQRWSNPPSSIMPLKDQSYGLLCRANSSTTFTTISDPGFYFAYNQTTGITMITTNFIPYCQNSSVGNNGTAPWQITPTSRSNSLVLASYDELVLPANSSLANISSVRAFFSAFQYRYWGSAWSIGDFTREDLADLMHNKDPRSWICPPEDLQKAVQCSPLVVQQQKEWRITPEAMLVKECYVLPKEELCTLRYSTGILVITLCFDIIKLSAIIAALRRIKQPLATLGDVISSFLRDPDPCTEKCGLLTEKQVLEWTRQTKYQIGLTLYLSLKRRWDSAALSTGTRCPGCGKLWTDVGMFTQGTFNFLDVDSRHRECIRSAINDLHTDGLAQQLADEFSLGGTLWTTLKPIPPPETVTNRRWVNIPTRSRWLWTSLLFFPALAAATVYFTVNFRSVLSQKLLQPWMTGFNAPDPNALLTGWLSQTRSVYVAAVLINMPQVAFSTLYFIFNATLTLMHTAHEWAKFSIERKALRVSTPRGQQRSTYWLQLPWAYSIPLVIVSGGMHWLLSRSLYVVKVDVYGYLGERLVDEDYFACGYSPIPALLLVLVLILMAISLVGLSFRKLPGGIPFVRLNSLAISSACHADPAEQGIELKPLMFGVVDGYLVNDQPHRSFTSKPLAYEQLWNPQKAV